MKKNIQREFEIRLSWYIYLYHINVCGIVSAIMCESIYDYVMGRKGQKTYTNAFDLLRTADEQSGGVDFSSVGPHF